MGMADVCVCPCVCLCWRVCDKDYVLKVCVMGECLCVYVDVCACVCVRQCACVYVKAHACVCVSVRACASMHVCERKPACLCMCLNWQTLLFACLSLSCTSLADDLLSERRWVLLRGFPLTCFTPPGFVCPFGVRSPGAALVVKLPASLQDQEAQACPTQPVAFLEM